ncbi:MAG: DUF3887 domain-containing protein [Anaerolineaceae bacterium]
MRIKFEVISLLILSIILGGCTATPTSIEGAERDAVLAYSEPMADHELEALNSNAYQAFIKDYDAKMREVTTQESFTSLQELIQSKLGKYLSREVVSVAAMGTEAVIVVYSAKFEKEEGVTIRLVFQPGGDHLITGLWFDSPKLRE